MIETEVESTASGHLSSQAAAPGDPQGPPTAPLRDEVNTSVANNHIASAPISPQFACTLIVATRMSV